MPKKSHRIASRQAAISRERKRKKRAQAAQRQPMRAKPAAAPPIEAPLAEPPTVSEPSTITISQPPPSARTVAPRFRYVTAEIRKIVIIAAVMLAILIALAFVLG